MTPEETPDLSELDDLGDVEDIHYDKEYDGLVCTLTATGGMPDDSWLDDHSRELLDDFTRESIEAAGYDVLGYEPGEDGGPSTFTIGLGE